VFKKAFEAEKISLPSNMIETPFTSTGKVLPSTLIGEVISKELLSLTKMWNKVMFLASSLIFSTVFPVTLMLPIWVGAPCASFHFSAAIKILLLIALKTLSSREMLSDDFWILITGNPSQRMSPSLK
jgi:hypothetical protein